MVIESVSRKTVVASSKEIPCSFRLSSALAGSHSNSSAIYGLYTKGNLGSIGTTLWVRGAVRRGLLNSMVRQPCQRLIKFAWSPRPVKRDEKDLLTFDPKLLLSLFEDGQIRNFT
jgi:hypothetical protein